MYSAETINILQMYVESATCRDTDLNWDVDDLYWEEIEMFWVKKLKGKMSHTLF